MSNKNTNNRGCGIASLIAMTLGCMFLLAFGILALTVIGEPAIAFMCGGIGLLGLVGCIALWIVMIRQIKQEVTLESKQQWDTGVLTDKVIKKDLYSHSKTVIIGCFAMSGVLAFFAIMALCFSEDITLIALIIGVAPLVTLSLGIKAIITRNSILEYRIETDKVLGGAIKTTFDVVDAMTTHLPTKTPVLYLEKYGEYKINSMHIHAYIPPEALVECIEPGEEVFVVYSVKTADLLHIYRKKYWERNKD